MPLPLYLYLCVFGVRYRFTNKALDVTYDTGITDFVSESCSYKWSRSYEASTVSEV